MEREHRAVLVTVWQGQHSTADGDLRPIIVCCLAEQWTWHDEAASCQQQFGHSTLYGTAVNSATCFLDRLCSVTGTLSTIIGSAPRSGDRYIREGRIRTNTAQ